MLGIGSRAAIATTKNLVPILQAGNHQPGGVFDRFDQSSGGVLFGFDAGGKIVLDCLANTHV